MQLLQDTLLSNPRVRATGGGHYQRYNNLIWRWGVRDAHLHGVEVGKAPGVVLEVQRHINRRPWPAALLGRGNNGFSASYRRPERLTKLWMQNCGTVLEFSRRADNSRLSIALHLARWNSQGSDGPFAKEFPQRSTNINKRGEILCIP